MCSFSTVFFHRNEQITSIYVRIYVLQGRQLSTLHTKKVKDKILTQKLDVNSIL